MISLQERNFLHLGTLFQRHVTQCLLGDLLPVLILCHDVPIDYKHGSLSLAHMRF